MYGYARSKADDQLTQLTVTEVGASSIAEKIDQSVSWIDDNVFEDAEVRMLVIPSYAVTAFWLLSTSGNDVVVIDRPIYSQNSIAKNRLYTFIDFVAVLNKTQPSVGVPDQ